VYFLTNDAGGRYPSVIECRKNGWITFHGYGNASSFSNVQNDHSPFIRICPEDPPGRLSE
jgi:hypothetical protein